MSAPLPNKISKSERKLMKKCNKSRLTVMKHEGIESVDSPSKVLCVNNAGLDNHVTQDEVYQLFSCHGNICDVIMLPRKPYAFVCFLSEDDAESAYKSLNGYKLAATGDRKEEITLYISFVSQAPVSIQPSTTLPPGLILLENFISDDYAVEILSTIDWDKGAKDQEKELKHRKVKHYGYEFKYSISNVDPNEPLLEGIPEVYRKLLDKALDTGHVKYYPDQLTINQYQPGQGIPPHVDTTSAFEDGLMSLSLGSQVNMEFRHPDGQQLSVLLPPNSLLIMTGESRYVWSHGITPRKHDIVPASGGGLTLSTRGVRTSFTFRKITGVKPGETVCSKKDTAQLALSNSDAAELENEHVHQVYEEIASHFSGTRHTPWPNIVEFLQKQEPGSLLADFGCGNGKYFGINKNLFELGSDRSFNLVDICKERKFEVFVGDVLSIPLREGTVDICLCIAVIHHLSTEERRLQAIQELVKILRVGGKALVYVWAMEQQLNKVKSKYLKSSKGRRPCCGNEGRDENTNEICNSDKCSSEQVHGLIPNADVCSVSDFKEKQLPDKCPEIYNLSEKVCDIDVSKKSASCDNLVEVQCNINDENLRTSDSKPSDAQVLSATEIVEHSTSNAFKSHNTKTGKINEVASITKNHDEKSVSTNLPGNAVKPNLPVHVNRTEFKQQDMLVPWQLKGKSKVENVKPDNTFHRFYHVFKKGELELLCSKVQDCRVIHSYYDQGNWAVVLEKI